MSISLRQLSRSRRLRAMGMLAWLLLAMQSLTAMPMPLDMHQAPQHGQAAHSVSMAMGAACDHHEASAPSRHCCDGHGGCCNGLTGGTCSCAAMTSTTLPSAELSILPSALAGMVYALQRDPEAPSVSHGPPLRPPAV